MSITKEQVLLYACDAIDDPAERTLIEAASWTQRDVASWFEQLGIARIPVPIAFLQMAKELASEIESMEDIQQLFQSSDFSQVPADAIIQIAPRSTGRLRLPRETASPYALGLSGDDEDALPPEPEVIVPSIRNHHGVLTIRQRAEAIPYGVAYLWAFQGEKPLSRKLVTLTYSNDHWMLRVNVEDYLPGASIADEVNFYVVPINDDNLSLINLEQVAELLKGDNIAQKTRAGLQQLHARLNENSDAFEDTELD